MIYSTEGIFVARKTKTGLLYPEAAQIILHFAEL
jgi:hypothetical protein